MNGSTFTVTRFLCNVLDFPFCGHLLESKVLYLNPLYPYLNIQIFNSIDIFYPMGKLVTLWARQFDIASPRLHNPKEETS